MKEIMLFPILGILVAGLFGAEGKEDESRRGRFMSPTVLAAITRSNVLSLYPDAVPGEQCRRTCDGRPKTCFFELYVEQYSILGPACRNCSSGVRSDCFRDQCLIVDGYQRVTATLNRQIPGPSIEVCRNDRVLIQINNDLPEQATTLHCHGLRQIKSPWMDGVPGVTQCAIIPFTTFVYNFQVPKAGTFWCHSHLGAQKLDAISLPLIIRMENDPLARYYDEDKYIMMIQDWLHRPALQYVPGIHNESIIQLPDNVLLNGLGKFSDKGADPTVPLVVFTVQSGKKYRIRFIAGTCMTCAYAVKISGHRLQVITADGGNTFRPTLVDSIGFNTAERFDAVLTANQTPGSYFIFVQGLGDFCNNLQQIAILHYESAGLFNRFATVNRVPTGSLGVILNFPNATCNGSNSNEICVSMLSGETDAPSVSSPNGLMYRQSLVTLGAYVFTVDELFRPGVYERFEEPQFGRYVVYTMNNCANGLPPSPLLTQFNDNPPSTFCNDTCYPSNNQTLSQCTNVVYLPLNAIVDIILVDTGARDDFNHAMHLHGYDFYVLAMGLFEGNMTTTAKLNLLSRRAATDSFPFRQRVMKDTITVPASGYAVIRFITDNPGFWIFHCHFEYHLENGMSLIFQVGNPNNMLRPSLNFPRCGNYYGV